MFDWDDVLQQVTFDYTDEPVDHAFIVDFLSRYFPDRPPQELGSKLFEVISEEVAREVQGRRSSKALSPGLSHAGSPVRPLPG